jgi:hypothetical protein
VIFIEFVNLAYGNGEDDNIVGTNELVRAGFTIFLKTRKMFENRKNVCFTGQNSIVLKMT